MVQFTGGGGEFTLDGVISEVLVALFPVSDCNLTVQDCEFLEMCFSVVTKLFFCDSE